MAFGCAGSSPAFRTNVFLKWYQAVGWLFRQSSARSPDIPPPTLVLWQTYQRFTAMQPGLGCGRTGTTMLRMAHPILRFWRPAASALLLSSVIIGFGWSAIAGFDSVTSFANLLARLLVLAALMLAVWRPPAGAPRLMWALLLVSTAMDLVAAGLWSSALPDTGLSAGVPVTESNPIVVPVADLLQLCSFAVLLAAVWLLRSRHARTIDWRVPGLDVVITVLSLSAVTWVIILKSPVSNDVASSVGKLLLELAYPALDMALLMVLMLVWINPHRGVARSLLRGMTIALVLYFLADMAIGVAIYLSDDARVALLTASALLLGGGLAAVGLTALYPHAVPVDEVMPVDEARRSAGQVTRWASSLSVAASLVIMLFIAVGDGPDAEFLMVAAISVIGLMLVVRQIVSAAGVQILLEQEVERRTRQLQEARGELEGNYSRIKSLLDHAPLAVAARDTEGKISLTNPAWDRMITDFPEFQSWQPQQKASESFTEVSLEPNEGPLHYFLAGCAPYAGGSWVVVTDITDVKTRESQLQQMMRMASLGEMATGLAHEINQPLGAMRLSLANAQQSLQGNEVDIHYVMGKLERLDDLVNRINKLVQGMKSFGRMDESSLEVFDAADSIAAVVDLLGDQLSLRRVSVSVNTIDWPAPCYGVALQFEQVLINLLNNSADAITEHGDSGEIALSIEADGSNMIIAIDDTGPGFPEDLMARLIEPFFTTKPVGKGTGLGLSYSQGIISDMGGSLQLENTSVGARVTLKLPRAGSVVAS